MTFQRPSNSIRTFPTPIPTRLPTGFQALPTAFQLRASNPPYPPALEAPNAAGVAAMRSRRLEGEGQEGPRSTHVRSNAEKVALWWRITQPLRRRITRYGNCYRSRSFARLLPGCFPTSRQASLLGRKQLIVLAPQRCQPLCPNHVALIGEGISRAGANSVFHSVEAVQARASRPTARETADLGERPELCRQIDPGGGWWGPNENLDAYFEVPALFRGRSQKTRSTSVALCSPSVFR